MKPIQTELAPAAIGPYAQGVRTGRLILTSGQLPICPTTGKMAEGIAAQTAQSLQNCRAVLEAAGASMADVVKTTVFLSDMDHFAAMNEVYQDFFTGAYPARSAVQAARLPKDALVEIECIAAVEG